MPSVAEAKRLPPGSRAPYAGTYEAVGPGGTRTGEKLIVPRGELLPSTQDPLDAWELVSSEQRRPPEMQVITKGWLRLKEERVPTEQLEQEDRRERRQA